MKQTDLTNGDMLALEKMRNQAKKELKACSKNELINLLISALVDVAVLHGRLSDLEQKTDQQTQNKE